MNRRHEGKIAIISGAASGIGQASAVRLAEEGAEIIIADHDKAEKTLQLIASIGGKASAVQCDVSNPASVAALKEAVEKGPGRCDILVNNAGIYPMQALDEIVFLKVAACLFGQPEFNFSDDQSLCRWNATAQMGTHHQHSIRHGQPRPIWVYPLYRQQGRCHRTDAGIGHRPR